jgi:hypothetical protein
MVSSFLSTEEFVYLLAVGIEKPYPSGRRYYNKQNRPHKKNDDMP